MNKSADNGGQYFSIKANTKAKVRFLYNTINDEVPYQLHEFNVNGKFKTIDCNRSEGDPLDNCKYCADEKIKKELPFCGFNFWYT